MSSYTLHILVQLLFCFQCSSVEFMTLDSCIHYRYYMVGAPRVVSPSHNGIKVIFLFFPLFIQSTFVCQQLITINSDKSTNFF